MNASLKVTVNFGSVRVIVPCGTGDISVREVLELAVVRYKKATNKPHDAWVTVHNVKSYKDDAILDQDDLIGDVCDDRENLIAIFAEQTSPVSSQPLTGDGTSASSVGTESPDIFIENNGNDHCATEKLSMGMTSLHVRRGSEPALMLNGNGSLLDSGLMGDEGVASLDHHGKRWSAAVPEDNFSSITSAAGNIIDGNNNSSTDSPATKIHRNRHRSANSDEKLISNAIVQNNNRYNRRRSQSLHRDSSARADDSDENDEAISLNRRPNNNFNRNANRRSMLASAYEWFEAADRSLANTNAPTTNFSPSHERNMSASSDSGLRETVVVLPNEEGPLGIHVVPEQTQQGLAGLGLAIQGIEPGCRVDRDGRLQVGDRIVEVNGKSLLNLSFSDAQAVFRSTLGDPQIVIKVAGKSLSLPSTPVLKVPPVVPSKPQSPPTINQMSGREDFPVDTSLTMDCSSPRSKEMLVGVTPGRLASLNAANTRRIGKKVNIDLTKGEEGLGFSLTTRDNLSGGLAPIYIKSILPRGAAIHDGRLRSGDRLLEVNGIEVTGKTQPEVVGMLRAIQAGSVVQLVVSRQECLEQNLPREIPPEKADAPPDEVGIYPWKERNIITLDIAPTDTGSAGLGISVKGKTSTNDNSVPQDMGLFIKSVIHGGAASKDGRLKPNDQLVAINSDNLLGKTNSEAMDTLRHAMFKMDGPFIRLKIARRLPSADSEENLKFEEGFLSTSSGSSSIMDSKENVNQNVTMNIPSFPDGNVTPPQSSRNEAVYGSINKRNPVIEKLLGSPGQLDVSSVLDSPGTPIGPGHLQQIIYGRSNVRPTPVNNSPPVLAPQSPSSVAMEKNGVLLNDDYNANPLLSHDDAASDNILNTSDMSLAIDGGFSRDGFGRQSMSEKRHAHLDAKGTDTYKKNKEQRMLRQQQPDSGYRLEQSRSGTDLRQRSMSQGASSRDAGLYRSNSADSISTSSQGHGRKAQTPVAYGHNKENKKPSPEFDHRPLPLVPRTPMLFPVQMFYPACCTSKYLPNSPNACPYHTALANGESPGTESSTISHEGVKPSLRCLPLSMQRSSSLESVSQPQKRGNSARQQNEKHTTAWDRSTPPTKSFKRVQRVDEDLSPNALQTPLRGAIPLDSFSPLSPDEKPRKKGFFRGMFRFGKNRKTIPEPGGSKHSIEAERRRLFLEEQKKTRQTQQPPTLPTTNHPQRMPNQSPWERTQVAATRGQTPSGRLQSADYGSSPNQNGLPLVVSGGGHPATVMSMQTQHQPQTLPPRSQRLPQPLEEWYHGRLQQKQFQQPYDPYVQHNGRPLPPIPAYGMSQFQAQLGNSSQFRPEDLGHFNRSISLRSTRSSHSHLDYGIVTRGMKQYTVYREVERPGSRVGLVDMGSPPNPHQQPHQAPTIGHNHPQYPHYANVNQLQQQSIHLVHQRQSSEPAQHMKPRPMSNYVDKNRAGIPPQSMMTLPAGAIARSSNPAHVYATMARPTAAPRTSMGKIPSGSKV